MTVYVDPLFSTKRSPKWPYTQSCHMTCDGDIEELHQMAQRLGLKRVWFQNHHRNPALWHYDLTASKRTLALRYGAKEITPRERSAQIQAGRQKLGKQPYYLEKQ